LLYVTGGAAWEQVKTSSMISANTAIAVFGQSAAESTLNTRSGYAAGAGIEWKLGPSWSARGEYLFYDFGGSSLSDLLIAHCATPGCGVHVSTGGNNISTVRMGLNYHFNPGYEPLK
jgi:outer membrane immunogenic protein